MAVKASPPVIIMQKNKTRFVELSVFAPNQTPSGFEFFHSIPNAKKLETTAITAAKNKKTV
jgi:hypothetical protein